MRGIVSEVIRKRKFVILVLSISTALTAQTYTVTFSTEALSFLEGSIIGVRSEGNVYVRDTIQSRQKSYNLTSGLYTLVRNGRIIRDFIVLNESFSIGIEDTDLISVDVVNQAFIEDHVKWMDSINANRLDQLPRIYRIAFPQMKAFEQDRVYGTREIHAKFWEYLSNYEDFYFNSPFFEQSLEFYLNYRTYQIPDSLIKSLSIIIDEISPKRKKIVLYKILSEYENSKVVGFDNIFVSLSLKYLKASEMELDTTDYKVLGKANSLLPNRVGFLAENFEFYNLKTRKASAMHDITGLTKVLFFFDPDCHHCKEAWPNFIQALKDFEDVGLVGVAIDVSGNLEDLEKFLVNSEILNNLVLGSNYEVEKMGFRGKYYIPSTPSIYLLNASNKVLARFLSTEDIRGFLRKNGF